MSPGRRYTIGELADEFDLTYRALRFYETRGLLSPERGLRQQRLYTPRERARLRSILALKALGFRVAEIQEMLADPELGQLKLSIEQVDRQIARLESERAQIDRALGDLRRYRDKAGKGSKPA